MYEGRAELNMKKRKQQSKKKESQEKDLKKSKRIKE